MDNRLNDAYSPIISPSKSLPFGRYGSSKLELPIWMAADLPSLWRPQLLPTCSKWSLCMLIEKKTSWSKNPRKFNSRLVDVWRILSSKNDTSKSMAIEPPFTLAPTTLSILIQTTWFLWLWKLDFLIYKPTKNLFKIYHGLLEIVSQKHGFVLGFSLLLPSSLSSLSPTHTHTPMPLSTTKVSSYYDAIHPNIYLFHPSPSSILVVCLVFATLIN